MRPFYTSLLLAFSLLFAQSAIAQWTTQSPVPTDLTVNGVGTPAPNRVFVATDDDSFDDSGSLFESTDGGSTWTQLDVPFNLNSPLYGVFFLDSTNGWLFGNNNYRTTDGGNTWTELPILGSTYGMHFFSQTVGYADTGGELWLTTNAGDDWALLLNDITAIDFHDNLNALAASPHGIYRTTDGGATFDIVLEAQEGGSAPSAEFLTATTALGVIDDTIVRSTDGGTTWTTITSAQGRTNFEIVSSDIVLAWSGPTIFNTDGQLLRSTDGGLTWTDLGTVFQHGAGSFTMVDGQTIVAADTPGNLFRSTDAGETWMQVHVSPGHHPSSFSSATPAFADTQNGYFGYAEGYLIKTTDGGATWSQISSGYGASLNDIDRFPDGSLVAVGEDGTLLTSDGLSQWVVQDTLTQRHLTAVDVLSQTELVVVDGEGRVYRSADGGSSWIAGTAIPQGLDTNDLHFNTLLDGWVIGSGFSPGALFHTTDGGNSWTVVNDFAGGYRAVDFEGDHGWAANVSGRYYYSHDNGSTWNEADLPGDQIGLRDMDFFDENVGYAAGVRGAVWRSDDGGITWSSLPTPTSDHDFTDIYLIGPNEFWLSTNDDQAYYTATGGQNWAVMEIGSDGFQSFSAIAASPEGDAWVVGFQGYIEHFSGPPPPPLNRPPVASFEFETNGLTVQFTDTSTDPDGTIESWFWEFDDGNTSTEQNPTHTFAEANSYLVRLTVTDDDGDTGSGGRIVVVQPGPGGTFGDFTEVTPLDSLFVNSQDEDFWVATTSAADFDNDDDLDIAVLGFYVVYQQSVEERLVLLRNDGPDGNESWNFTYMDVPLNGRVSGASDLAWADFDGDGDQDLVMGTNGETVLYQNNSGTLVEIDAGLPGYYEDNDQADFDLRSITWADYDNDGDDDLLLPSIYDSETFRYRTALMRNDGPDGTGGWLFTETDSTFATASHAQSQWADEDGDGDLDLLLVNLAPLTTQGFITRYTNNGDGTFDSENILGSLTIEHGEAQWGDFDSDGDYDVLIAGNIKETNGTFTNAFRVYVNDAGTYNPFDVIDCIPCDGWFDITAATWADYDSDGDIDILMTGSHNPGTGQIEGRARVFLNDGSGAFVDTEIDLPAPRPSGTRGGSFTWLDIDSEGDLDYFIAGDYWVPGGNGLVEAQMHLYRNDVDAENLVPTEPTGMQAIVGDPDPETGERTVSFDWNPASDDSTPASALTYDLEVRLAGAAVAEPRRLPEPGSVTAVTNWKVDGLPDGDYVWTLRAVDNAYAGGPTAEGSFTVGSTSNTESDELPVTYSFDGTFPNPFRRSTTLRYGLPEHTDVQIRVYDMLGRFITELVNEEQTAGYHEIRWENPQLASGAYLVRMTADSFQHTQRITVIR